MKLTLTEAMRLQDCEKIIQSGKKEFVRVGLALEEIRDKKLYRSKFGTFQEYCLKRWGFSRSYGYQLIEDAKVAEQMSAKVDIPNHAAAHALAKVEPQKRAVVAEKAASSGPVTAKSISRAAKDETKADVILDETGYPVPTKAMPFWNRRDEVQKVLTTLSAIKSILRVAQDSKDLLFVEVNISGAMADLEKVFVSIKTAKPYAVCTSCQGKLVERCQHCGGRGVLSQFRYSRVPPEVRAMREPKK